MNHCEFDVGIEFHCGGKAYRCTDIGSRVVTAIRTDQVEVATKHESGEITHSILSRTEAEARGWLDGPPFAVVELVFDENDLQACEPIG